MEAAGIEPAARRAYGVSGEQLDVVDVERALVCARLVLEVELPERASARAQGAERDDELLPGARLDGVAQRLVQAALPEDVRAVGEQHSRDLPASGATMHPKGEG